MLRIPGPLLLGPQRLLLGPLARGRRAAVAGVRAAMSSAAPRSRRPLRGVVFDMDGTLTVPVIDFPAMYREVLGGDEAYAAARAAGGGAVDILHCIEGWAPDKQRHAYEVIARFEKEGLDRLQIMPADQMTFAPALSREFRPYKPDPAPLLHICSTWNIPPHEVIMVGRYGPHDSLPEEVKPDFMVSSLTEVFTVLEENFDLAPVPAE
nr:unnamed protein product [Digitaria exilis]